MGAKNLTGIRRVTRSGKLHWVIDFRFTDADGARQRFRRDPSAQLQAVALAEAKRFMARAHETGSPEEPVASAAIAKTAARALTFAAFVDGIFSEVFMPKYRPSTRGRYEDLLRQGIREHFGPLRLDAIDGMTFRGYAAKLQRRKVQLKGPLNFVRTILRAAHEAGELKDFPSLPKLIKQGKKLPDTFTEAELITVYAGAKGWLRTAIWLGGRAGLRMGEVLALEARDVDLATSRLFVRHAMSGNEVLPPKSGDERVVPLFPELAEVLRGAMKSKLPRARVIINERGRTPKRTAVLARFKVLLVKLGVEPRSFHSLRHSFVTQLIRRGASVEAVRLLAGHSSLKVTERYVHATADDLALAMAKLGGS
jgi:integrase